MLAVLYADWCQFLRKFPQYLLLFATVIILVGAGAVFGGDDIDIAHVTITKLQIQISLTIFFMVMYILAGGAFSDDEANGWQQARDALPLTRAQVVNYYGSYRLHTAQWCSGTRNATIQQQCLKHYDRSWLCTCSGCLDIASVTFTPNACFVLVGSSTSLACYVAACDASVIVNFPCTKARIFTSDRNAVKAVCATRDGMEFSCCGSACGFTLLRLAQTLAETLRKAGFVRKSAWSLCCPRRAVRYRRISQRLDKWSRAMINRQIIFVGGMSTKNFAGKDF